LSGLEGCLNQAMRTITEAVEEIEVSCRVPGCGEDGSASSKGNRKDNVPFSFHDRGISEYAMLDDSVPEECGAHRTRASDGGSIRADPDRVGEAGWNVVHR